MSDTIPPRFSIEDVARKARKLRLDRDDAMQEAHLVALENADAKPEDLAPLIHAALQKLSKHQGCAGTPVTADGDVVFGETTSDIERYALAIDELQYSRQTAAERVAGNVPAGAARDAAARPECRYQDNAARALSLLRAAQARAARRPIDPCQPDLGLKVKSPKRVAWVGAVSAMERLIATVPRRRDRDAARTLVAKAVSHANDRTAFARAMRAIRTWVRSLIQRAGQAAGHARKSVQATFRGIGFDTGAVVNIHMRAVSMVRSARLAAAKAAEAGKCRKRHSHHKKSPAAAIRTLRIIRGDGVTHAIDRRAGARAEVAA